MQRGKEQKRCDSSTQPSKLAWCPATRSGMVIRHCRSQVTATGMRTAGWETVFPPLSLHWGFLTWSPVTQQPGTGGYLWVLGHP